MTMARRVIGYIHLVESGSSQQFLKVEGQELWGPEVTMVGKDGLSLHNRRVGPWIHENNLRCLGRRLPPLI